MSRSPSSSSYLSTDLHHFEPVNDFSTAGTLPIRQSRQQCEMVSPFPVRPAGPERRYSARYLLLVYENTPPHFDPLEIRRLARLEQARCTIIREQLVDDLCNYLAFIDFAGKRFQTRNERLFDIQGYHPKWCPLSSAPATYYDQCLKRGHVVLSEAPRPRDRSAKKPVTKSADWEELTVSSNRDDFFDTCKEQAPSQLAPQLDRIRARLEQRAQPPVTGINSDVSRLTSSWTDGFKAGFEAGMNLGSSAFSASRASG